MIRLPPTSHRTDTLFPYPALFRSEAAVPLLGIVVARILELPAGVKLGHDDLGRRNAFLGVDAGRDAAAIILDADRSVAVQRDEHQVAMPRQRLVDRIVRNQIGRASCRESVCQSV